MPPHTKPILLLLAALAAAGALFASGLHEALSLEQLKAHQAAFEAFYAQHPALTLGAFFALYVVVTAVSFPGAAVLTLAGGALFGLTTGLVLVSFASSLGATLAFLASRYLLRGALRRRFAATLARMDRGLARDGWVYLLSLRLAPIVPFFVINLALGLTAMRTAVFYGVSQLGMLPGTFVYVNAGTQLGGIASTGDVLSPGLLAALTLLAAFPFLARRAVEGLRHRESPRKLPAVDNR